jgi:hypothetical protein
VKRAELVAVGIAHVSEVHWAKAALAQTGRIFATRSAIGDSDVVELFHLLWRVALKADGAAIGSAGGLAIDRFRDSERSTVVAIENPRVSGWRNIGDRFPLKTENAKNRVVE